MKAPFPYLASLAALLIYPSSPAQNPATSTKNVPDPDADDAVEVEVVVSEVEEVEVDDSGLAKAADLPEAEANLDDSIARQVAASSSLSKLNAALDASGFDEKLAGPGPFTLFAPTNRVFEALGEERFKQLLLPANRERLVALLELHLVPGIVAAEDLETGTLETVAGDEFMVLVEGDSIEVGEVNLSMADKIAGNGVIHLVDGFIQPIPSNEDGRGREGSSASTVVVGDGVVREVSPDKDLEVEPADAAEDARKETREKLLDARDEIAD